MALFIPALGAPRTVTPAAGVSFTLQELQAFVGGYLEVLYLAVTRHATAGGGTFEVPHIMCLNEEGKLHGLPVNRLATAVTRPQLPADDVIVGDVLICSRAEMGEDDEDSDEDEDEDEDSPEPEKEDP